MYEISKARQHWYRNQATTKDLYEMRDHRFAAGRRIARISERMYLVAGTYRVTLWGALSQARGVGVDVIEEV